ncbi:MAG: S8 family serine peptidase, partial [Bacteriovorax sp.]
MNKMLLGPTIVAVVLATGAHAGETTRFVPGEIIVKFKPGVNAQSFLGNKSVAGLGLAPKREIKLTYQKLNVLSVGSEKSLTNAIAALKKSPEVVYAEPNYIYSAAVMPKEKAGLAKRLEKSP